MMARNNGIECLPCEHCQRGDCILRNVMTCFVSDAFWYIFYFILPNIDKWNLNIIVKVFYSTVSL